MRINKFLYSIKILTVTLLQKIYLKVRGMYSAFAYNVDCNQFVSS